MHLQARTVTVVTAFLLSLGGAAAAEDLTVVSRVTPPKGPPTTSTQYISAAKVRTADGTSDSIVDIATGRLTFIDHQKKSFYETSFQEIQAHFAELEQMLESNPMLESMFGGANAVKVEKTGETRSIAGYTCQKYNLSFGPNFAFEVWAAPDLKPPVEYFEGRKLHYASAGPFAGRFEKMIEEMKKIGGFPLATTIDTKLMGFKMHSETEATEVNTEPIPPAVFEPPVGYKQKKSPFQK
jgi:hypothetical protein